MKNLFKKILKAMPKHLKSIRNTLTEMIIGTVTGAITYGLIFEAERFTKKNFGDSCLIWAHEQGL